MFVYCNTDKQPLANSIGSLIFNYCVSQPGQIPHGNRLGSQLIIFRISQSGQTTVGRNIGRLTFDFDCRGCDKAGDNSPAGSAEQNRSPWDCRRSAVSRYAARRFGGSATRSNAGSHYAARPLSGALRRALRDGSPRAPLCFRPESPSTGNTINQPTASSIVFKSGLPSATCRRK